MLFNFAFHILEAKLGMMESAERIVIKSRNERNLQCKKCSSTAQFRGTTILVSGANKK